MVEIEMPLDGTARRLADELFNKQLEEIVREQQQKRREARTDHARRGMAMSGSNVATEARIQEETISRLAEARVESLLTAYEQAGIPFDDAVRQEITDEVSQFCELKKNQAIATIPQFVNQMFGGVGPPNMIQSASAQLEGRVTSTMAKIARDLRIRGYRVALEEQKKREIYGAALGKKWDVFISHASEDKDAFVRPLANALVASGLTVWYDEFTLRVGDSLRQKIDQGLAASRYGVVILSLNFFAKEWPQQELDGLYAREVAGVKVILPVWHNITADEVRQYSPLLAGKLAATGDVGKIVTELRRAMGL
jgi:TIR domain